MKLLSIKISFLFLAILSIAIPLCYLYITSPFISYPRPSIIKRERKPPPCLAYYISGSAGDVQRLKRLLQAVYHPYNIYIAFLDDAASPTERRELYDYIDTHKVFSEIGNVRMIAGPVIVKVESMTKTANLLHAAAILLKEHGEWDWLINLDAFDYPLVTQDDLLFALSRMPRRLNFIDHTSDLQKDFRSNVTWNCDVGQEFYDIFAGSFFMALSRPFMGSCIRVWERYPRYVFNIYYDSDDEMTYSEPICADETFFPSVVCLYSKEFTETVVNTDLRFNARKKGEDDNDPDPFPGRGYCSLTESNAPFARKFDKNHASYLLDWIDRNLLHRGPDMLVPGGWCADDRCMKVGLRSKLSPGPGSKRLREFLGGLVAYNGTVLSPQCVVVNRKTLGK